MIHHCFCFVLVVHESLVCSEQFNCSKMMLLKVTRCIKSRAWKLFEFEDQGKLYLSCLSGKHASIFCCFRRAVLNVKTIIFLQNKNNLDIFILFKSFHARLLMHRVTWMFEPFLIVVFESLNCAPCEKMDLKIIQSLLERAQICRRCWKTEESAGHEDFSTEQSSV